MHIKKIFPLIMIAAIWAGLNTTHASAQITPKNKTTKKKPVDDTIDLSDDEEETHSFKDHLWYGGGLILGFNSTNIGSQFAFGITPMAGYKFNSFLSAGPRVGLTYNSFKFSGLKAVSVWDVEPGVFLRAKIFRGVFLHGEIGQQYTQDLYTNGSDIIKDPVTRSNQYLGIGYNNSDGGAGYDIYILYNFRVANETNTIENPLGYRIGFTWNF